MLQLRKKALHLVERAFVGVGAFGIGAERFTAKPRLIFVCTGNICRSPYAERVAVAAGLSAISCGTHAKGGDPANPVAVIEAARRGVDLGAHRTRRWQDIDLMRSDIIVAAQLRHALYVRDRSVSAGCRVLLMSALLPRFHAIDDPYARNAEDFQIVYELIDRCINTLVRATS